MIVGIDAASVDENKPFAGHDSDANGVPEIPSRAEKLYQWGARFAIFRSSFVAGGHAQPDPFLAGARAACAAVGITVGAYMILGYHPDGPTPETQVATFVKAYGSRAAGELPVWLDVEFPMGRAATGLSAAQALAWIERAYDALVAVYGVVGTYTSARVWIEDLADLPSKLGDGPLWLKVPYPWKRLNPPHLESVGQITGFPRPWAAPASPGCALVQFQGDAVRVPGCTSTVDINRWFPPASVGSWLDARLPPGPSLPARVQAFQTANALGADGVIGPSTFAILAR